MDEHYNMSWLFSSCLSGGAGVLQTAFLLFSLAASVLESASRGH